MDYIVPRQEKYARRNFEIIFHRSQLYLCFKKKTITGFFQRDIKVLMKIASYALASIIYLTQRIFFLTSGFIFAADVMPRLLFRMTYNHNFMQAIVILPEWNRICRNAV